MEPTETATEAKRIIDPLSGEELSQEDIDNEVTARVDALQFATKEEIEKALKVSKGATSTNFLKAFSGKEMPRLTAQEVRLIAATNGLTPPSVQINNLNKSGLFPNHNLKIEAETEQYSNNIVSRVLCNTRIALSQKPVDETTKKLHEELKSIQASLDPKDSALTEFIISQYLGMPLNHLALYTGMDEAEMSQSIERINLKLAETKAHIHVRNGVAILGTKDGAITIFNNEEARKNLFPPKKENERTSNLETELNAALTALSAEREKTAAAELKATDLTQRLLEAEDIALHADEKAEQAQSKATSLETEKQTLVEQLAQLELDIQEALRISAETAQGSGLEDIKKEKAKVEADLKKLEKKLEDKTAELTASREEARTAREEARIAKSSEVNLRKQLEAARKEAREAEEARAETMRGKSRSAGQEAAGRDHELMTTKATLERAQSDLEAARRSLQRERGKITIEPQELNRLKTAATTLDQSAKDKIDELQRGLEQKAAELLSLQSQVEQLAANLLTATQNLEAKSTENTTLTEVVTELTREVSELTALIESSTATTPATPNPQASAPTAVVPSPAPIKPPQPSPAPIRTAAPTQGRAPEKHGNKSPTEQQITKLGNITFKDGNLLIVEVKKILALGCGESGHGFPRNLLPKLKESLLQLDDLNDWAQTTRNRTVKAINAFKEKYQGTYIPVDKIEAFIQTLEALAI